MNNENQISIKPSIAEAERFIQYLNTRFNLGLRNDLIVLIHETRPTIKGFFRSIQCQKIWKTPTADFNELSFKQQKDTQQKEIPLNSIVLSSHTLRNTPYETIAHEIAHYVNFINGIKDCSSSQYHNKHFKSQAERLLLKVEKDKRRGYAYTEETESFKAMLKDFKPNLEAFQIFQTVDITEKKKSRLLLYECSCGSKIRSAKNENKPLMAICLYCKSPFKVVDGDD